ncbi:MAG: sulfite exporter TauE/SafE family protein [Deltaproteobacteria bacterium]|nr:sulfite exporter TauE/SafE family protein [Deltaproteobacteria bacterium]
MIVLALVLAIFVGVALGLLGGGGSILTLPILQYVVGIEAHAAIAASLFVVGATSLVALIPHARGGRVDVRVGLLFGSTSMAGAYLAGRGASFIPPGVLLVLFAVMMVVTAFAMLRGRPKPDAASADGERVRVRFTPSGLAMIGLEGLVVGAVTGLVGAGGGFLVVPALVVLGKLPMRLAVGTSLMVIALKSFAGFAGHASQVALDWPLVLGLTAAALVGSLLGARAAGRVDPAKLRRGFGWFVVVMGVFMLAQELPKLLGLDWPFVVALGLAALAALTAVLVERSLARAAIVSDVLASNPALPTSKGS